MTSGLRIRGMGDNAQNAHIRAVKDAAGLQPSRFPDERRCSITDAAVRGEGSTAVGGDSGRSCKPAPGDRTVVSPACRQAPQPSCSDAACAVAGS